MMEVATYASGPPFHIKPLADGRTLDAARVGDELAKDDVTGDPLGGLHALGRRDGALDRGVTSD
jgi:hypothetical protein